jgi:hypothetical protein
LLFEFLCLLFIVCCRFLCSQAVNCHFLQLSAWLSQGSPLSASALPPTHTHRHTHRHTHTHIVRHTDTHTHT